MSDNILEVLKLYDIGNVINYKLIRHNENKVYKIISTKGCYVLRIHEGLCSVNLEILKVGLPSYYAVKSELEILETLSQNIFPFCQQPIYNTMGDLVSFYDNRIISVLTWINGESEENTSFNEAQLFELGVVIGKMHRCLKNCKLSCRIDYGMQLAKSLDNELKKAYGYNHINFEQYECMANILEKCRREFEQAKNIGNISFVHADLGKSNFIRTENGELLPIDFSLSGRCIPEYDLASAYLHFEKDRQGKKNTLLDGYKSVCGYSVDEMKIQLCMCYQIVMFIACQHDLVFSQPWFKDTVDYWCNYIIKDTLKGTLNQNEIGLYQA